MKLKILGLSFLLLLITGCMVGNTDNLRLKTNVNPSQVSLDNKIPVSIEASVENIANSTSVVSVDVEDTEGLIVKKPERTRFTLKPGESRVVIFEGKLEEDAVPGKYRIEVEAQIENGGRVTETAFLNVVIQKGIL